MAIDKEKKKEIVSNLKEVVADSNSVVFVNFHGLGVTDTTELRSNLRKEDVGYVVAKKTLIRRVLDDAKFEGEIPVLDGEIALAYAEDLTAPARGVFDFHKKHKENISIIGGVFDGVFKSKDEMTAIAEIPALPVLYGQFVNLINSPIQRFAVVLDQIAQKREV